MSYSAYQVPTSFLPASRQISTRFLVRILSSLVYENVENTHTFWCCELLYCIALYRCERTPHFSVCALSMDTTSCCLRFFQLLELLLKHATALLRPFPRFLRLLHEFALAAKSVQ